MSLSDALEIQQRKAALRPSLAQRVTMVVMLLPLALFVCLAGSSLLDNHDGGRTTSGNMDAAAVFAIIAAAIMVRGHLRQRRRIAELEIEVLELRRRLGDKR